MPVPTPTLVSKTAPAGHLKLKVTNLTPDDRIALAEFQIARNNTFTTGLETIEVRTAPCEATFAIDTTYRRTTHYARVRLTQWNPPVLDTDDLAGTETTGSWSSTLTLSNGADQVVDDDITSLASTKVTGRAALAANGQTQSQQSTPSGTTNPSLAQFAPLSESLVSGKTYKFQLIAVVGYNAATDLRFALDLPSLNEVGTYYTGRWGSASYNTTSLTSSGTVGSPTYYHGKSTTGTVSITQSGSSSSNYFTQYIEFAGRLSPSDNGDIAFSFGPDVATTAVILPWVISGHLDVEDITTSGTL